MKPSSDASSMTALTWPSKSTGSTTIVRGPALKRPEPIGTAEDGTFVMSSRWRSQRALAEEAFADLDVRRVPVDAVVGIGRELLQPRPGVGLHLVHDALVRLHERRELGEQHAADGREIALALQHAGEPREVRLEPVLLGVAVGRQPQVVDHRVDVVLELGDLAARVDLNRSRQVALRDGGRDLGDRAHLRREVRGEQVDVAGEVLPRAGGAGHVGLAAEPAFDADLARDGRDLIGERRERLRHVVDRLGERRDFALRLHGQALRQVAVGDGGDDLDDAADLLGEVRGHDVDVVGEVLPRAGDAGHVGLAAEPAVGADLARDARDFGGERVELVDHRVDGVLELEDLALDVDGDLAREVAARDGGRDLGDVADLRREVRGEQVDVVGEVLPRAADAGDDGLAAELALGADLARDARDFGARTSAAARPSC